MSRVPLNFYFVLLMLSDGSFAGLPYQLLPLEKHMVMLSKIFYGVLAFYVYIDLSISEQLKAISTLSYLLFQLYKENTTSFIPAQLYNNLQCTFHDALLCAAKLKISSPEEPLYLVRNGTDIEEHSFGTGLTANCENVMDVLSLINEKHPNWSKKLQ